MSGAVGVRVVVHTGPGKTGSSAVQHWLTTHAEELRQVGVFYPAHDMDENGVSSGNRDALLDLATGERGTHYAVNRGKAEALLEDAREGHCHTLLLSSEFFHPAISGIQEVFPDAEFIVYLRDPLELHESNYNQSVKRHDEVLRLGMPARFHAGLWAHTDRQLSAKKPPRLVLRAYAEGLFEGGNIVGDVLSVVGVLDALRVQPEAERINPSYTFDALEFKRHANHFQLGPLQPIIDRALQTYPAGVREYSLVPPEQAEAARVAMLAQLDALVTKHGLDSLRPLRDHLAQKAPRPFVRQVASDLQLAAVGAYLSEHAPEAFLHLRARVERSPHLALPNPAFYACFGVTPTPPRAPDAQGEIKALVELLEKQPHMKAADYAREIALHFERRGEPERAREFMETAFALRPEGEGIRAKVNQYRREGRA